MLNLVGNAAKIIDQFQNKIDQFHKLFTFEFIINIPARRHRQRHHKLVKSHETGIVSIESVENKTKIKNE